MPYALGAVKPHVKLVGEQLGERFGIRVIYGWAPGKYEHPKGLALDFMTSGLPNERQVGDALAAYLIANAASLGVTYVIWWGRIWSVERASEGWRSYSGPSDHKNHVHASFSPTPGVGMLLTDGATPVGWQDYVPGATEVTELKANFDKLGDALTNGKAWLRVAMFVLGCILVALALSNMTGTTGKIATVAKTVVMKKAGG